MVAMHLDDLKMMSDDLWDILDSYYDVSKNLKIFQKFIIFWRPASDFPATVSPS